MADLFATLDGRQKAQWAEVADGLEAPLLDTVAAGDVVMVKGSLGSRMAPLVLALNRRFQSEVVAA
jgi:UDP-N-acetylmuramyl pentapeptide synthase